MAGEVIVALIEAFARDGVRPTQGVAECVISFKTEEGTRHVVRVDKVMA